MDLNEIGNTVSDIILSEYNKKIKYDLGLEDYLKSYTKDELLKFYATYLIYNDKLDELLTFKAINGQKKDEIISKVSSNIRNIMNTFLCIMRSSCFNDLKKYFKDSNCEAVIAGCTELSVAFNQLGIDLEKENIVDSLTVLAKKTILLAGKNIKK